MAGMCHKCYKNKWARDNKAHTRPKKKISLAKWRKENKQPMRDAWLRWADKNTEWLAGAWKRRDQSKAKQSYDKWYAKVRTEFLAKRRQKYQNNLEAERARCRAYEKANRNKRKAKDHKRRAQKLKTQIGPVDFDRVLRKAKGKCGICSKNFTASCTIHFDHIIPLSKGGPHVESNLQAAHARCNLSKGNKLYARAA